MPDTVTHTVTISKRHDKVLKAVAKVNNIPVEQYMNNIVLTFLEDQTKGIYRKEFNKKTENELAMLFGEIK